MIPTVATVQLCLTCNREGRGVMAEDKIFQLSIDKKQLSQKSSLRAQWAPL